jgi:hypothetical protein
MASDGLADAASIVQLQDGDLAAGILGQEGRALVLAAPQIHGHGFKLDALLRRKYPDPTGIGCAWKIVQFHLLFSVF